MFIGLDLPQAISLLYRKMNTELNERLGKIGLSKAKSRLLRYLYKHGQMAQIDLSRELDLDKSTVAKVLARLEDQGLVSKMVNPEDTRSFLVSLTPKSEDIIPKSEEVIKGWCDDLTSVLTEGEKQLFYELLYKVSQSATEITSK
ncbi:MAG: MarR family transcriptional regulator [Caldicoprobacterales bacterium]